MKTLAYHSIQEKPVTSRLKQASKTTAKGGGQNDTPLDEVLKRIILHLFEVKKRANISPLNWAIKEIKQELLKLIMEKLPEKFDVSHLKHNPLLRQKYYFNLGCNEILDEVEQILKELFK